MFLSHEPHPARPKFERRISSKPPKCVTCSCKFMVCSWCVRRQNTEAHLIVQLASCLTSKTGHVVFESKSLQRKSEAHWMTQLYLKSLSLVAHFRTYPTQACCLEFSYLFLVCVLQVESMLHTDPPTQISAQMQRKKCEADVMIIKAPIMFRASSMGK